MKSATDYVQWSVFWNCSVEPFLIPGFLCGIVLRCCYQCQPCFNFSSILGFLAEVRFEVGFCSACALLFPAPLCVVVPRLVKTMGLCLRFFPGCPDGPFQRPLALWSFLPRLVKTCPLSSSAEANIWQYFLPSQVFDSLRNAQRMNRVYEQLFISMPSNIAPNS